MILFGAWAPLSTKPRNSWIQECPGQLMGMGAHPAGEGGEHPQHPSGSTQNTGARFSAQSTKPTLVSLITLIKLITLIELVILITLITLITLSSALSLWGEAAQGVRAASSPQFFHAQTPFKCANRVLSPPLTLLASAGPTGWPLRALPARIFGMRTVQPCLLFPELEVFPSPDPSPAPTDFFIPHRHEEVPPTAQ